MSPIELQYNVVERMFSRAKVIMTVHQRNMHLYHLNFCHFFDAITLSGCDNCSISHKNDKKTRTDMLINHSMPII